MRAPKRKSTTARRESRQDFASVAELVASQRRLLGVSTYVFAKGCQCSESTVRFIETGRYHPSLLTCFRIADFLKLPRDYVAKLGGYVLERADDAITKSDMERTVEQLKRQVEADPIVWKGLVEVLPSLSKDARDRAIQYVRFLKDDEQLKRERHG
jgi:DNA-binding XRE family transcriptional regulator